MRLLSDLIGAIGRGTKPRRVDAAMRLSLVLLSRLSDWRSALVVVRAGDLGPLPPSRIQALLEVEVARRTAADSDGVTRAHPTDDMGKPIVGCAAQGCSVGCITSTRWRRRERRTRDGIIAEHRRDRRAR